MYSEKQYNDFLQEITVNNIPHFSTDWFNIKVKEKIDYIKNNIESIKDNEWDELMSSCDMSILRTIICHPKTPIKIVCKAVDLCKSTEDKLMAFTREDLPIEYIHKIYDNHFCHDLLHKEVCKHIEKNTVEEIPYHKEIFNYLGRETLLGRMDCKGRYEFGALISDENIIKEIVKDKSLTESKVDWILKNPFISENLKNNIFDAIDFNYNDIAGTFESIKNPTQHMMDVLYRQAIDTLDYYDNGSFDSYNESINAYMIKSQANCKLYELQRNGYLTDNMCIDLINRKINSSEANISDETIEFILKTTNSSKVLISGLELKNKNNMTPYENKNLPNEFFEEKFSEYMTKIEKELEKNRTDKKGGKISKVWYRRICSYVYHTVVGAHNFDVLMDYYNNDFSLFHNIAESKYTTPNTLRKIIALCRNELKKKEENDILYTPLCVALFSLKYKLSQYELPNDFFLKRISVLFNAVNLIMHSKDKIENYPHLCSYKDYKNYLFDTEIIETIKELSKDNILSEQERNRFKIADQILENMKDMSERDADFNPSKNTTYYLQNEKENIEKSICFCTTICDVYDKIDDAMDKYFKIKNELQNREDTKVKEKEEIQK